MDLQNSENGFVKCEEYDELGAKRLKHFQTGIFAELDEKKENLIKKG